MKVGQGPNWGCSAKEKKFTSELTYLSTTPRQLLGNGDIALKCGILIENSCASLY
jgi:hypothetical protein